MKEILTYHNLDDDGNIIDGVFTREFEIRDTCDACINDDGCYVDGELPGLGFCPLKFTNLISRALTL